MGKAHSTDYPPTQRSSTGRVSEGQSAEEYGVEDLDQQVTAFLQIGRPRRRITLLDAVRRGLPFSTLERLAEHFGTAQKALAQVLAITPSTLARRKASGKLKPEESDRVVRLARIGALAESMMQGDSEAARQWVTAPLAILGGESPLRRASTELGARDVEQLIGRLRHGVFS